MALAGFKGRTLAYIADEDEGVVRTVDVDSQRELAKTKLGGRPSALLIADDGRVFVTLRDKNQIAVLEPAELPGKPLALRCSVDTKAEPVALAVTPDEKTLLVSSAWARSLAAYDASNLEPAYAVVLPREPRAIVVSDDGKRAFVSHVVGGRMSAVSLVGNHEVREIHLRRRIDGSDGSTKNHRSLGLFPMFSKSTQRKRIGCQGFALAKSTLPAGRIFAPQVMVDPGNSEIQSSGYGDGIQAAEQESVAVIDEDAAAVIDNSLATGEKVGRFFGGTRERAECLLPRAAAIDTGSGQLLVSCYGIDSVVAYDAGSAAPHRAERRRWAVGAGPSGIAVDARKHRALVWSQFDATLNIIDLAAKSPRAAKFWALSKGSTPPTEGDVELGRRLFHSASDPRISSDGRACASCHPDGREDSLTWATPSGPRQTPMLAGRLRDTAPYGWDGKGESIEHHLGHTFARLRGVGLKVHERDALVAYIRTMEPPVPEGPSNAALVERGRDLFLSKATGCAGCHQGGQLSTDGKLHDVKSQAPADNDVSFNTPSLRYISGTAPYFHDGRYATLRELLKSSDGKMGHTAQLSPADLNALEAYLKTL